VSFGEVWLSVVGVLLFDILFLIVPRLFLVGGGQVLDLQGMFSSSFSGMFVGDSQRKRAGARPKNFPGSHGTKKEHLILKKIECNRVK